METATTKKWGFEGNDINGLYSNGSAVTVGGVLMNLKANLNIEDGREVIPLGHGDPSPFSCFRTTSVAEDAIVDAVKSAKFNCYPNFFGILPARRAVADYLSCDLPYELSPDDVFITIGAKQAIEVSLAALSRPGANILIPRPGFPHYETFANYTRLEVRHFDLLPDRDWEVDLEAVETLADENTAAIVIINPGNPCGTVYRSQHLKNIAEVARKLGVLVISDEAYAHLAFGSNPFLPMGIFGSIVPVLTVGSLSKRWLVPGWRLGWLVATDPNGVLKASGVVDSIINYLKIFTGPATLIQGAIPHILANTKEDFYSRTINILREAADICYNRIQEIPCLTCPRKPEGSMFLMTKLNLSEVEGIEDDFDFCLKLAKEESVIVLPGFTVGLKNWLRVTFSLEPKILEEGLERIKAFCERHAKKQ